MESDSGSDRGRLGEVGQTRGDGDRLGEMGLWGQIGGDKIMEADGGDERSRGSTCSDTARGRGCALHAGRTVGPKARDGQSSLVGGAVGLQQGPPPPSQRRSPAPALPPPRRGPAPAGELASPSSRLDLVLAAPGRPGMRSAGALRLLEVRTPGCALRPHPCPGAVRARGT